MLLLAIDTATPRVSVALGRGGRVIGDVSLDGGRRHAEQLVPAIEYLCRELDVGLHQLAAIAVGLGPGLFTGLRVGVTPADHGAEPADPRHRVPSLDLIAIRSATRHGSSSRWSTRRHEVFFACWPTGMVQRITSVR